MLLDNIQRVRGLTGDPGVGGVLSEPGYVVDVIDSPDDLEGLDKVIQWPPDCACLALGAELIFSNFSLLKKVLKSSK